MVHVLYGHHFGCNFEFPGDEETPIMYGHLSKCPLATQFNGIQILYYSLIYCERKYANTLITVTYYIEYKPKIGKAGGMG